MLLISRQPVREETYKVFDYADQIVSGESWYLPEALWDFAMDTEGLDEVWQVAVTADTVHKRPDIAQRAYQKLLQRGDPSGALGIGRQLALEGRIDDAREWFEQAIEDSLSWVMLELGILLASHDRDESVIWLRRALDAGYPEAAPGSAVMRTSNFAFTVKLR